MAGHARPPHGLFADAFRLLPLQPDDGRAFFLRAQLAVVSPSTHSRRRPSSAGGFYSRDSCGPPVTSIKQSYKFTSVDTFSFFLSRYRLSSTPFNEIFNICAISFEARLNRRYAHNFKSVGLN